MEASDALKSQIIREIATLSGTSLIIKCIKQFLLTDATFDENIMQVKQMIADNPDCLQNILGHELFNLIKQYKSNEVS